MEKAMKGLSSSRTTHSWMACVCATSFPKKQERAVAINRRWRSRSKSSFCTIKPTLTQSVDIITTRPLTHTYVHSHRPSPSCRRSELVHSGLKEDPLPVYGYYYCYELQWPCSQCCEKVGQIVRGGQERLFDVARDSRR